MNPFWTSLVGLAGVVLGVLLNEAIRRTRRIESFAPKLFEKRLERYEELLALIHAGYHIADDVMTNPAHSYEDRHNHIASAILKIANFADREELYIEPDLGAHCVATFMGAEDVLSIEDDRERAEAQRQILLMYKQARRMIREDAGVLRIEKLFRSIHNPRIASPVIDRIRYLRSTSASRDRDDA